MRKIFLGWLMVAFGLPHLASASIQFQLDKSLALPAGPVYATVELNFDTVIGSVAFTVDANETLYGVDHYADFGIQEFAFNVDPSWHYVTSGDLDEGGFRIIDLDADWVVKQREVKPFGEFSILYQGTADSLRDPLKFTVEVYDPSDAVVENFAISGGSPLGAFFAAYIAGDPGIGQKKNGDPLRGHWVVGARSVAVPEPSAFVVWSLLGGCTCLVWRRRVRSAS